jgi:hypothetical protein
VIHAYRYISALCVLLVACTTYGVAVVPWFEPPPIVRPPQFKEVALPQPALVQDCEWLAYFRPDHWVHKNPKIVKTQQCTLFIQDYRLLPDGRLELTPCTLVFHSGKAKHSKPIILEAPKAELTFDRPMDFARAEFGRLEKGTLAGEVTILSPPTTPGGRDELRVRTRAVWLDQESIRTSNEVEFQYGASAGRGRILEIALSSEPPDAAQTKKKKLPSVHTATLKHLDHLHVVTENGGILRNEPADGPAAATATATLEVKCQGEVSFDVTSQLARFERQVEVRRLIPGAPPDELNCETLLLAFAENNVAEGGQPPATLNDPLAGRLKRIVALGSPAVLQAPTSGVEAIAAHMEYSLADRSVTLKSDPKNKVPQVSLRRFHQHFVAPDLHYQMADEGRLGRLYARGPGELRLLEMQGGEQRIVTARWEKELQVQPQERNQVISLHGTASVAIDPLGRFDGNELHVWVLEVAAQGGAADAANPQEPKTTLVPDRLLAIGNVRLRSPQLDVDTGRLESWFINLPAAPAQMRPLAPPQIIREPVQRASYTTDSAPQGSIRNVVRQPTLQKFHVGGEKIQMQAVVRGRVFDLEDLNIDGRAEIDEIRTPEPNQIPIRLRGDLLELRQGTRPEAVIQVSGKPAEVSGRGVSIAGGKIVVHRGKNELRIDGPGEATMPGPETGPRGQEPAAQPPQQPMHLVWQQGLIFDGRVARFAGDVKVRTAMQTVSAPVLEAKLSQRLDFQLLGGQPQPELESIFFDGGQFGVDIKSRTVDEYGEQVSREQMRVRNLLIDRLAGKLHAAGPGWVSTVRRGGATLPGSPGTQQPLVLPQQVAAQSGTRQMTSIHVAFEREIVGDLARREIEFRQQVQTTYSPTNDFGNAFAADPLAQMPEGVVLMESDSLKITEIVLESTRWFEMLASGHTKVRGLKVDVDAPIIGYSSATEILSLRGDGRAKAKIWTSPAPGQPATSSTLERLSYNIRTGDMQTDGVGNVHIPLAPGMKLPFQNLPGTKK